MTDTHPVDLTMGPLMDAPLMDAPLMDAESYMDAEPEGMTTPCLSEEQSECSEDEDEDEEEDAPPAPLVRTTSVSKAPTAKGTKAPRKALATKKPPTKKPPTKKPPTKKPPTKRTVRRPYKSMNHEKLISKQEMVETRFNTVKTRYERLQTQLERFNNEIALRDAMPEQQVVEV
jgi:hypothetical protein